MPEYPEISDLLPSLFDSKDKTRAKIMELGLVDSEILAYRNEAEKLWAELYADFIEIERHHGIPYSLREGTHFYAIDLMLINRIFGSEQSLARAAAKLYAVIFLLCSYYDDHVEHRDKLFGKFIFKNDSNLETQHGAVPFSATLILYELLVKYLEDLKVPADKQVYFLSYINKVLLSCTKYFAGERDVALSPEAVLEMKQHNVSGKIISLIADILILYCDRLSAAEEEQLKKGLYFAGSLMQMTDDVRDSEVDRVLNNANLYNVCIQKYGYESGIEYFCDLFMEEYKNASISLNKIMKGTDVKKVLSIPFYPFCF